VAEDSRRVTAGRWYLVTPVASLGLLASVPFWHAYRRIGQRPVLWKSIGYTVAPVVALLLAGVVDDGDPDTASFLEALPGLILIATIVSAVILLIPVRRTAYGPEGRAIREQQDAIARSMAGRHKREAARELLRRDPAVARDLGIGRPDLARGFDDGGLVDLNSAPAAVIAAVCRTDSRTADAIVARRERVGPYYSVDDVVVDVSMPPDAVAEIQERGVV
jgi:hypothetical protein